VWDAREQRTEKFLLLSAVAPHATRFRGGEEGTMEGSHALDTRHHEHQIAGQQKSTSMLVKRNLSVCLLHDITQY
jgi:hypothetical protein